MKIRLNKKILLQIILIEAICMVGLLVIMFARKKVNHTFSPSQLSLGTTEKISLSGDSYEIEVKYTAGGGETFYQVLDDDYVDDALNGDLTGSFDPVDTTLVIPFWLYHKTDELRFFYTGDAIVHSAVLRQTNALFAERLLFLGFVLILFDFVLYRIMKSASGEEEEIRKNKVLGAILVTTLLSSLPLTLNYLIDGHDISFHLMRIEGIKEGLMEGRFPVRMNPYALNGQGYADPIFYPNLFLYIPAILRIIGLPVLRAYKILLGLMNLATCVVTYSCLKSICRNSRAAVTGMVIYALSPYHLACLYTRGAVGETLAMIFLPVVILGMCKLLSKDVTKDDLKKGSLALVLGLTGILQSHVLSCEMVGIFLILTVILTAKRAFRPKVLLCFLLSAVVTVALNIWFLIPFLQSYGMDLYVFKKIDIFLHENGLTLYQLFGAKPDLYGLSDFLLTDIREELGVSLGIAVPMGIVFWLFGIRGWHKDRKSKVGELVPLMMVLGTVSAWMTTYYFPWKQVESIPKLGDIVRIVQFPWRYLGISTICFTVGITAFLAVEAQSGDEKRIKENRNRTGILIAAAIALCILNCYFVIAKTPFYAPYSKEGLDKNHTFVQAEYLYTDTSISELSSGILVPTHYERKGCTLVFDVDNLADRELCVDTPMIYYPYYVAKDTASKERFRVEKNAIGTASFYVPSYYKGQVKFYVPEAKKWILGDIISLITLIGVVIFAAKVMKKKPEMGNEQTAENKN